MFWKHEAIYFFKHFPECLVFDLFIFLSHISISAGHSEDHPCVRGPGWDLEHGTAAPCWSRAVLLHPGSQWGNGLHARGRARRSVHAETTAWTSPTTTTTTSFLCVSLFADTGFGTIYVSDDRGTVYSKSLERHLYTTTGGETDFTNATSLRGVFITSILAEGTYCSMQKKLQHKLYMKSGGKNVFGHLLHFWCTEFC